MWNVTRRAFSLAMVGVSVSGVPVGDSHREAVRGSTHPLPLLDQGACVCVHAQLSVIPL